MGSSVVAALLEQYQLTGAVRQVFAKGLLDIGTRGVVVALPVKLDGTGQLKPGLDAQ